MRCLISLTLFMFMLCFPIGACDLDGIIDPALSQKLKSKLFKIISKSIQRKSPYTSDYQGDLFDNAYDLHSSIHAHWSALSIAKGADNRQLVAELETKLSLHKMQQAFESIKVESHATTYASAWFLILASERFGFAADLSQNVLTYLEQQIGTLETFKGNYNSLEFAAFAIRLSSQRKLSDISATYANEISPAYYDESMDRFDDDFLSLPHLVSASKLSAVSITNSMSVHQVGAAMTSGWVKLSSIPLEVRPAYCKQVLKNINHAIKISENDNSKKVFAQYSHWLPQFAYMILYMN